MSASHEPFPRRPFVQRVSQRLADWCWSLLTRDLRPRPYPSRLQSLCSLISDLIWYGRSLNLPDDEDSPGDAAWTRRLESEELR